jgi:Starch/carbohydrate-binding module (family 53)
MKKEQRKGLLLILKEMEEDPMIQQQIQQKASRIASEQELGALQKECHTQRSGRPLPATMFHLLLLLFSCWLFFGPLEGFGFLFLGPFCLILCILLSWSYWSNYPFRHSREFLYEHGFLLIACRNEHIIGSEAIRWDEVRAIRYHFSYNSDAGSREESYTLQYADESTFGNHVCEPKRKQRLPHHGPYAVVKNASHDASMCEYRFPPELGRQIESRVLPYLIPRAFATYQQGLPIRFGSLTLHLGGIEYEGKFLPWHNLQCRFISHNKQGTTTDALRFLEKGDQQSKRKRERHWAWVHSSTVPNFAVLWHLVSQGPPPVSCNPLVAGRVATITYSGWLADCSSSLTLHWGYNGWNHIVDTRMTNQHNGIWQATLLIPSDASVVNMAFFNQDDAWDNKDSDNYNLNIL